MRFMTKTFFIPIAAGLLAMPVFAVPASEEALSQAQDDARRIMKDGGMTRLSRVAPAGASTASRSCGRPACPGDTVLFSLQNAGRGDTVGVVRTAGDGGLEIGYLSSRSSLGTVWGTVIRAAGEVAVKVDESGGFRAGDEVAFTLPYHKGSRTETGVILAVFSDGTAHIEYLAHRDPASASWGFAFRRTADTLTAATCVKVSGPR